MNEKSIGHISGETGTCAGVFTYKSKKLLLSCAHVLAPQGAKVGDDVLHPGVIDSLSPRVVGKLKGFTKFKAGSFFPNSMDVAVAHLTGHVPFQEFDLADYTIPIVGQKVSFSGRSTPDSEGHILDTNYRWTMLLNNNVYGFDAQIQTSIPSTQGDSGSLVRDETAKPIGIVIGEGDRGAIVTPLWKIFTNLNKILGEDDEI